jgi:hypothetical protein
MKQFLFIFWFIASCTFCCAQVHYRNEITKIETFNELKGLPNTNKFGAVDAVKVLLDIHTNTLYFLNANTYKLHVDFCVEYLGYNQSKWKFNVENYDETKNRDFLMGTINYFQNQDKFILEFSVADQITLDQIQIFHEKIMEVFKLKNTLYIFLNTNRMRNLSIHELQIPTIESSDIFEGLDYQALNLRASYGCLKFVKADALNYQELSPKDIVVINGTPNDLPPVAGVITTDFQTPLSHITLLCMNRGTPMAAVKKAWDDSLLRSMEGLPIYFQVNNDGLKVEKVSKELVDSSFSTSKLNQEKIILDKDTTFYGLLTPQEMEGKLAIVGGKAAHFGELHTAVKKLKLEAKLPEDAFAIPFAFYESHIKEGGIDKLIQVLPNMVLENDQETLKEQLDYIQYKIKRLPLSQELLELVKKKVAQSSFQKFRFRSSTNAEDIEGFNGAGLYTSKSAELNNPSKSIEKAIKKVWASTWSYKAFMERSYFGIDQKSVAMAILCHRSFPGESANGVVITKNLYRKNYRGFVVNAQKGDVSVVKPPIDVTCEQLICYSDKDDAFYGEKEIVEYISYSNILEPLEKSVLSTDEVIDLTRCLSKIKKYMYQRNKKALRKTPYHEYGLDFEFKLFGKTRQLYIKQMRPF